MNNLRPCATFSTSGPSYLDVGPITVHHLYNVGANSSIVRLLNLSEAEREWSGNHRKAERTKINYGCYYVILHSSAKTAR